MKRLATAWAALLLVAAAAGAAGPSQQFLEAGAAYNAGRFEEAARLYEEILAGGYAAPALYFNLGNACYRQGKVGKAVLNYRKAWQMSPRDPEIVANLRFALEAASAVAPSASFRTHLLTRLNAGEWAAVAVAGYWAAAAVLCAHLLTRRRFTALPRAAIGLGILAGAGLCGAVHWRGLERRPEAVVVQAGQQALFAPLDGSTPHFALPEGSIVRLDERSGGWLKVASGGQAGWIPEAAAETVDRSTL
jgi:tetratricopeptide (TPR) repeat protein